MHELAICQALMSQNETIASARNAIHALSIVIGTRPLSVTETRVLEPSSKNNAGTARWFGWLDNELAKQKARPEQRPVTTGRHRHHNLGERCHHHHDHSHGGDERL